MSLTHLKKGSFYILHRELKKVFVEVPNKIRGWANEWFDTCTSDFRGAPGEFGMGVLIPKPLEYLELNSFFDSCLDDEITPISFSMRFCGRGPGDLLGIRCVRLQWVFMDRGHLGCLWSCLLMSL